jgi:uncharacterized protein YbjT (DUF2867 family)
MSAANEEQRPHLVAVAGGTGTLGGHLVDRLTGHGIRVRILARDPEQASSLENEMIEVVPGDVRDRAALEAAVQGCDAVVSAFTAFGRPQGGDLRSADLQGNINLIRAAETLGGGQFVLVSLHGAAPDSPMELGRVKYQVEQVLRASRLGWTIVRPTASMELYVTLLAAPLLEHQKARIFGRGDNPVNFVSQRDVAAFVELALTDSRLRGQAIDVGGPENLSVNQLVHRFEELTGAAGSEQHIPRPMLRALSVVVRPFSSTLARQAKAAVLMDTTDMTFDDSGTARSYPSIHPTSLEEVVRRDFEKAA